MLKKDKKIKNQISQIRIPGNLAEGIHFFDKIIIQKSGNKTLIFSSACTHLGCKITTEKEGLLVCPCHGSAFDLNGNVQKGPARKSLTHLPWKRDESNGDYIIDL
ncbi:MAG: Rieske (2Fe-2S) protein [Bacteroidales bacterium]|nr:Rieske (2Fe-2S) protein [Bacteroidales bacterium]